MEFLWALHCRPKCTKHDASDNSCPIFFAWISSDIFGQMMANLTNYEFNSSKMWSVSSLEWPNYSVCTCRLCIFPSFNLNDSTRNVCWVVCSLNFNVQSWYVNACATAKIGEGQNSWEIYMEPHEQTHTRREMQMEESTGKKKLMKRHRKNSLLNCE